MAVPSFVLLGYVRESEFLAMHMILVQPYPCHWPAICTRNLSRKKSALCMWQMEIY